MAGTGNFLAKSFTSSLRAVSYGPLRFFSMVVLKSESLVPDSFLNFLVKRTARSIKPMTVAISCSFKPRVVSAGLC
jgi:hypothetical protein